MLQSWSKGFRAPPLFHVFLYGICCQPAIHIHKHGLNKIPPPPLNKVEVLNVCKICKKCLTSNTQHCSWEEGEKLELHFPHLKHSVLNVLTRIVVCFR